MVLHVVRCRSQGFPEVVASGIGKQQHVDVELQQVDDPLTSRQAAFGSKSLMHTDAELLEVVSDRGTRTGDRTLDAASERVVARIESEGQRAAVSILYESLSELRLGDIIDLVVQR